MLFIGVFATATKYAESYIVMKHRVKNKNKQDQEKGIEYTGGAMYVLENQVNNKLMAVFFAVFTVVSSMGMGSMIQSNSIANMLTGYLSIPKVITGIALAILCAYILFGGLKRISKVNSVVVPLASVMYIVCCIWVLCIFKDNIWWAIQEIVSDAFGIKQIATGGAMYALMHAMRAGVSKGIFSNEAGMGSSPILESSANIVDVRMQALTSSLGVVIDTVLLCTLTGVTMVATKLYTLSSNPIEIVNMVFGTMPFGRDIMTVLIIVFVVATIPGWEYYGEKASEYLKIPALPYKIIYIIFMFLGALVNVDIVWCVSSIANAFMIFPNTYMIWKMRHEIKNE